MSRGGSPNAYVSIQEGAKVIAQYESMFLHCDRSHFGDGGDSASSGGVGQLPSMFTMTNGTRVHIQREESGRKFHVPNRILKPGLHILERVQPSAAAEVAAAAAAAVAQATAASTSSSSSTRNTRSGASGGRISRPSPAPAARAVEGSGKHIRAWKITGRQPQGAAVGADGFKYEERYATPTFVEGSVKGEDYCKMHRGKLILKIFVGNKTEADVAESGEEDSSDGSPSDGGETGSVARPRTIILLHVREMKAKRRSPSSASSSVESKRKKSKNKAAARGCGDDDDDDGSIGDMDGSDGCSAANESRGMVSLDSVLHGVSGFSGVAKPRPGLPSMRAGGHGRPTSSASGGGGGAAVDSGKAHVEPMIFATLLDQTDSKQPMQVLKQVCRL